jgi:hypothetical protein
MDCTPACASLPGGVCSCPHYGYVFSGRVRCVYPGSDWPDEVAVAGDVFFFRAGHVLVYEEASEVLELNPAAALQVVMDEMEDVARQIVALADGDTNANANTESSGG